MSTWWNMNALITQVEGSDALGCFKLMVLVAHTDAAAEHSNRIMLLEKPHKSRLLASRRSPASFSPSLTRFLFPFFAPRFFLSLCVFQSMTCMRGTSLTRTRLRDAWLPIPIARSPLISRIPLHLPQSRTTLTTFYLFFVQRFPN